MGKKILLADDSITIQKVIELTFSDEDFDGRHPVRAYGRPGERAQRATAWLPGQPAADRGAAAAPRAHPVPAGRIAGSGAAQDPLAAPRRACSVFGPVHP